MKQNFLIISIFLAYVLVNTTPLLAETHLEKVAQMRAPKKKKKDTDDVKNPFKKNLDVQNGHWFMSLDEAQKLVKVKRVVNRKRHHLRGLKRASHYKEELNQYYTDYKGSMRYVKFEEALIRMIKKDAK